MPRTASMKPVMRRPGRSLPWCVTQAKSISPTGRRRDKWFSTKEKAKSWIKDEEQRLRSYSDKARGLSDEQKLEAGEAFAICQELNFRLIDAVREKAAVVRRDLISAPVSQMVDEAITQLEKENKSATHIRTARYVGKKFKAAFPDTLASQLTTAKIQGWLDSLSPALSPETLKQYRRYVSLFCEHGRIRGGYLQASPTRDVKLSYKGNGSDEVSILTPEQVKRLLNAADDKLRPYLAILAFAGLRPSEAQGLWWKDIDLDAGIYVRAASAKTRKHRFVMVRPNLRQWLGNVPTLPGCNTVYFSRRAFRRAVKNAGLEPWQEDCLRHSFGSYWLALHHDENRLAQEMGNSPAVIITNYRRPVNKKQAEEYFKITP